MSNDRTFNYSFLILTLLIIGIFSLALFGFNQKALADTAIFYPTKDIVLYSDYPTTNINDQYLQVKNLAQRHYLVSFDTSSSTISTSTSIISAKFCMYGSEYSLHNFALFELTSHTDWIENQATWNQYKTGSNWSSAGGDYSWPPLSVLSPNELTQWWCFDLINSDISLSFNTIYNWAMVTSDSGADFNAKTRDGTPKPYLQLIYNSGWIFATSSVLAILDNEMSTTTSLLQNMPNFHEWLVVCAIIIFFISFSFWHVIAKPVSNLFKNNGN